MYVGKYYQGLVDIPIGDPRRGYEKNAVLL